MISKQILKSQLLQIQLLLISLEKFVEKTNGSLGWVWIAAEHASALFWLGPCIVYKLVSTENRKSNFKTKSHDTIHTFKNYFATVFSVFNNKQYSNRPLMYLHFFIVHSCRE